MTGIGNQGKFYAFAGCKIPDNSSITEVGYAFAFIIFLFAKILPAGGRLYQGYHIFPIIHE